MPRASTPVRFQADLHRPATPARATWTFVVLPAAASAKLPTRSMVAVEGRFEDQAFRAILSPDGKGSHWLKVTQALRKAAGANVGDRVTLEIRPSAEQPEVELPPDLARALRTSGEARGQWDSLTPIARRDWIQWLESAKRADTRERRVVSSIDMLECGKRRVCCFDRSGIYSQAFDAPEPAK